MQITLTIDDTTGHPSFEVVSKDVKSDRAHGTGKANDVVSCWIGQHSLKQGGIYLVAMYDYEDAGGVDAVREDLEILRKVFFRATQAVADLQRGNVGTRLEGPYAFSGVPNLQPNMTTNSISIVTNFHGAVLVAWMRSKTTRELTTAAGIPWAHVSPTLRAANHLLDIMGLVVEAQELKHKTSLPCQREVFPSNVPTFSQLKEKAKEKSVSEALRAFTVIGSIWDFDMMNLPEGKIFI